MANLMRKTRDALANIAVGLGLSAEGTKAEIVERIENAGGEKEATVTAKAIVLGEDVKATPINATLKKRAANKKPKPGFTVEDKIKARGKK